MSTNISKKKRDDLLDKIKQIRAFIAAAPQDENTGNLLSYLSELEKDVNGKKYGLVFEEHREEIDEVLDTHTPVLTEDADLFIDHGGQMNFLLEGDNLAALKLLEKTHRGKIDLIYIQTGSPAIRMRWMPFETALRAVRMIFCGKESKKNIEIPRSPYTLTPVRKPWLAERSLSGWPAGIGR